MRYMIIVKATPDSEAGRFPPEPELTQMLAEMARYHEELHKAGVLLDGSGLKPSSKGWRVSYGSADPVISDGPFAETKELIAGYTLIQVKSREEAVQWSRRFPNPAGRGKPAQIEVRELYEIEEIAREPAMSERFRKLEAK
jgi:hypothetical protein